MKIPLKELEQNKPMSKKESIDLAEAIYDEFVDYIQSQQGWLRIGSDAQSSLDERQQSREFFVERSRTLARREPLSKQSIRLYRSYSGMLKVEFKSTDESATKVWEEKFWNLHANKRVLSPIYRAKLCNRLLTDGEMFLAIFTSGDGEVRIRTIDPLQIPEDGFVTSPDDDETVLYYKRIVPNKKNQLPTGKRTQEILYYRDWLATDEDISEAGKVLPDNAKRATDNSGNEVLIFHVPFDPYGQRGNGLLFAAISYIETFRNFLQDRATIVRGLSTYIRKITLKGGSKAVKDVAAALRSTLTQGLGIDRNPPDVAGSTWVQNQQLDKTEQAPITGAGDAMNDARIFRQPIGSAVGITESNLTGDPGIGNLASQEQMDGPQLQNFLDFQQLWEEVFTELWGYVMQVNGKDEDTPVDIDLPRIIKIPLAVLWTTIQGAVQSHLVPFEEASRILLMALGSNDIDDLIEQSKGEKDEAAEEQKKQFEQGNLQPQGAIQPGAKPSGNPLQQKQNKPRTKEKAPVKEFKEHGVSIEGSCPFCGETECLKEAHNVIYCEECEVSFSPSHFEIKETEVAFTEKFSKNGGANGKGLHI